MTMKRLAPLVLAAVVALGAALGAAPVRAEAAWYRSGGAYYYRYDNGAWARNAWVRYGSDWYYVGADYKVATNRWVAYGDAWYYLGANGKVTVNGWAAYAGAWFYMGADGKALVNTSITLNGTVYSFGPDGTCVSAVAADQPVTFERALVADTPDFTVTFVSYDAGGDYFGNPTLIFTVESHTDKQLSFATTCASVNGYMAYGESYEVVEAGGVAVLYLELNPTELANLGIETITDVSFILDVRDVHDYASTLWFEPVTLESSAAGSYVQPTDDTGEVLYSAGGITIVSKGVASMGAHEGIYLLFINESDTGLEYMMSDAVANGSESVGAYCIGSVLPGKRAISEVSVYGDGYVAYDLTQLAALEARITLRRFATSDVVAAPTVAMTF